METFIIFDNGGRTPDRYTILNKMSGEILAASADPTATGGIGRSLGNCANHRILMFGSGWRQLLPVKKVIQAEVQSIINNARLKTDWIGSPIEFPDLPEKLRTWLCGMMERSIELPCFLPASMEPKGELQ
jgi:hypothetical protein